MMVSSQEARWFLDGNIDNHVPLQRWVENGPFSPQWSGRLGGKPDIYIVIPNASDLGLKWREGQLQIKGLESTLGIHQFRGGHAGVVERWLKWSYRGAEIESRFGKWFHDGRHIEVFKTRCLRKFRLNPFTHQIVEVEASAAIDRGGCLEVTDLRVNEKAYVSIAFEMFPNDPAMPQDFSALADMLLETLPVRLSAESSLSYPGWLQTL